MRRVQEFLKRPASYGAIAVAYIVTFGLAVEAIVNADSITQRFETQQVVNADRRAENCRLFIDEYRNDVNELGDLRQGLDRSRVYLRRQTLGEGLTRAIRANLSEQKASVRQALEEATDSVPPSYCPSQPGVPYPNGR